MNIQVEKKEIVERFNQIEDIELITAVKHLIDYGLQRQTETDFWNYLSKEQKQSIERGINQADDGELYDHDVVMAGFKEKYLAR